LVKKILDLGFANVLDRDQLVKGFLHKAVGGQITGDKPHCYQRNASGQYEEQYQFRTNANISKSDHSFNCW